MNLSPKWAEWFQKQGLTAIHWSSVGPKNATDEELLIYADKNDYILLTNDLDFGAILAYTQKASPSVLQIRSDDLSIESIGNLMLHAMTILEKEKPINALVTLDISKMRMRFLPIK